MSLYPHQVSGVEWLAPRKRAGLFDDMGLGKTITAIVAAKQAGVRRMLVVAPSVVAWNWRRESEKWMPGVYTQVLTHSRDRLGDRSNVVICSHGLLIREGAFNQIRKHEWDLIVLDEAHYFRNHTAQRTRAFYGTGGLIHHAKRVWLLTGTPLPNNASEMWTHLRGLWPDRCPYSFDAFRREFCELEWSPLQNDWKVVGNKNLPKLKAMMDGLFLRRLKGDHLDLPPIRWESMVLEPDDIHIDSDLDAELRKLMEGLTPDQQLNVLRQHEEFARWRRLCGEAKVAPAAELLDMELETGTHKVVVAAHHLGVIASLKEKLARYAPAVLTGEVDPKTRQAEVDRFQQAPGCRVAICQLQSAGVGITLTAATEVVFVETSPTPGDNAQLADRAHRIGQTKPVRVRVLSLAGSVDELFAEINLRKSRMISEAMSEESPKSA